MNPTVLSPQPVSPDNRRLSGTLPDNILKFICEFKPDLTPGNEDFSVSGKREPVSVVLPAQCSIYQLRMRIYMQVGTRSPPEVV